MHAGSEIGLGCKRQEGATQYRPVRWKSTFQMVALEWCAKQAPQWSPAHADRSLRQFERDLFPWLGARRMLEIKLA